MQCVILAAGKGTRLRPLTESTPKPLVKVAGKPLLDHIVSSLPSEVDEIILVVGYLGDQIRQHCGHNYFGRKVTYVEQIEQKGTGHALWLCKDLIKGRFLYMFADDIHGQDDLEKVASYERAMLVLKTDTPERFGIALANEDGTLKEFLEKPKDPPSNLASTGVFVLDEHIFDFEPKIETNGEFYHTPMVLEYSKHYPVMLVEEQLWIPIGYPEDIERANEFLTNKSDSVEVSPS